MASSLLRLRWSGEKPRYFQEGNSGMNNSKSATSRSPGRNRAQHLPGISTRRLLALVTMGLALTLIVVPGVPDLFASALPSALPSAADEPPAAPATEAVADEPQKQLADKISGWIKDLGSDSWSTRQRARKALEKVGEEARSSLAVALKSDDPEIQEHAKELLATLDLKKKRPAPATILTGPAGNEELEKQVQRMIEEINRDLGRWSTPFGGFPTFPDPRNRPALGRNFIGPHGVSFGGEEDRGWSQSTEIRFSRDGQIVMESRSSSSSCSIEPLGVLLEECPEILTIHLPSLKDQGVLLAGVRDGSPAHQAGLRQHDILLSIGDQPVKSLKDARNLLMNKSIETLVGPVRVLRAGQRIEVKKPTTNR